MPIINDPNQIAQRTALQVERDIELQDLAVFGMDLNDRVQIRKERKLNFLVSDGDKKIMAGLLRKIAAIHFNLKYGEFWEKLPDKVKVPIIKNTMEEITKVAVNELDPFIISTQIQTATCPTLEQELNSQIANYRK